MKVTIIGTGYVGLVSGAVFANWGHTVICLDIEKKKVENIKKGIMPIYEEGLEDLVDKVQNKDKRFEVTADYKKAVEHGEVIFICVGTPGNQAGAADLGYVDQAAQSIGKNMPENTYKVVVTKSTVPVGTHNRVFENVKKGAGSKKIDFDVASCPEFLREGTSIYDANNSDRTVIGSNSEKALDILSGVYETLTSPIVRTDIASAELIKYAANAFLATKISFINEMSQICERTGADVVNVATGMGLDKRIGPKFLNAGIGYGGSCFPKDVKALISFSKKAGYDFKILEAVHEVNEDAKNRVVKKIEDMLGSLKDKRIAILGLAFKPDTDDMRDAPAIHVISKLLKEGASVIAFDPQSAENAKRVLPEATIYAKNIFSAVKNADIVVVLTEWREFSQVSLAKIKELVSQPNIVDMRNVFNPAEAKKLGFNYIGVGRR